MQYQLPQFIEVEDKIIGPFTFRQFVYIAGGAGLCYMAYALARQIFSLPLFIALIPPIPIAIFAFALAFYKVNNRPFITVVESAMKYYSGGRLYLWRKEAREVQQATPEKEPVAGLVAPRLSGSKLKDLSWSLDVSDNKAVAEKIEDTANLYKHQTSMTSAPRPVDLSEKYSYHNANSKTNTSVHTN